MLVALGKVRGYNLHEVGSPSLLALLKFFSVGTSPPPLLSFDCTWMLFWKTVMRRSWWGFDRTGNPFRLVRNSAVGNSTARTGSPSHLMPSRRGQSSSHFTSDINAQTFLGDSVNTELHHT